MFGLFSPYHQIFVLPLTSLERTILLVSFVRANKSKVHWAELGIVTFNLRTTYNTRVSYGNIRIFEFQNVVWEPCSKYELSEEHHFEAAQALI